jgi:hypothetical protein
MKCFKCDECLKVIKTPVLQCVSYKNIEFQFCSYKCAAETFKRFIAHDEDRAE